jgi:hypothetical protein
MVYKTITTEVDVDVDLDDFDDDELLDEVERRNLSVTCRNPNEAIRLLEDIYYKRVTDKDFSAELDRYFYLTLGRSA